MIRVLAIVIFVAFIWTLLRFALGLRSSKLAHEEALSAHEQRGYRVVAEIPQGHGPLSLFLENDDEFNWGTRSVQKPTIAGARILLNKAVIGAHARDRYALPPPPTFEEFEGSETWQVLIYLVDGGLLEVPCGSLREGVSRDIALSVFKAVRHASS